VLDDPVEPPADQLRRTLWTHPCRHPHLAAERAIGDPLLQRLDVAASERDLGQMKRRHAFALPN
jgi:hypothetical protein